MVHKNHSSFGTILETVISAPPGSRRNMPGVPGIRLEPVSIEVSGSAVSIVLTQGAINIWFGKKFDKSLIAKILLIISKVDSTTEHEKEVLCRFEEISEFESNGYILTSYARKKDKYRAIFVVPFSNSRALEMFMESIALETENEDAKITLYWRGGRVRMNILKEELGGLSCFSVLNVVYKDDQNKDQQNKDPQNKDQQNKDGQTGNEIRRG